MKYHYIINANVHGFGRHYLLDHHMLYLTSASSVSRKVPSGPFGTSPKGPVWGLRGARLSLQHPCLLGGWDVTPVGGPAIMSQWTCRMAPREALSPW